jgi:hypothetical protein
MAQKRFRRWLRFRLAALFWLVLVASLVSLWLVHRQRRIERNARLDEFATQAKRLRTFTPYMDYNLQRECDREEVATRWLMEIARRKGNASEEQDALRESAARLKRVAARVRILEQAGSAGGAEHDVAFIQSRQAEVQVALAQLSGSASEVRDSLITYVRSLRRYRDAILKVAPRNGGVPALADADLAAARVVQAELNRDAQMQIAALHEQLAAVQEFARALSNRESNALGIIAADFAAARIQARLACVLQNEIGEVAAWQEAAAQLQKLHAAYRREFKDASSARRWTGGEIDFAFRLPQPNLLIDFQPPVCLSQEAESLKLSVLEELAALCGEAALRAVEVELLEAEPAAELKAAALKKIKEQPFFNLYWDGLQALAEFQLENAGGSPVR